MKRMRLSIFYFLILLYIELVFRAFKFGNFFSINILNIILFIVPLAIILSLVGRIFDAKYNKIINLIIICILCVWANIHFIYHSMFDVYFSFSLLKLADQAASFWKDGVAEVFRHIFGVILLFVPFISACIFKKNIDFKQIRKKDILKMVILGIVTYLIFALSLLINKKQDFSAYQLYYKTNNNSLNIQKLGLFNSTLLDIERTIFGFDAELEIKDEDIIDKNKKHPKDVTYKLNNQDIDFDNLIANESDSTVNKMHQYFSNETGTYQNKYSGIFKDKNLILFMAESFNEIAVDKELTPTLYKLVNSSFVFDNFYTPVNNSTIGGEFQELTGLFANNSQLSKWREGTNSFPYGVSTVFKNIDYKTYAYHDNSYTFQSRNKYLKALGFDNFLACKNGLETRINCNEWPESDIAMINTTYTDWINEDKFMVYYITVSGHGDYVWSSATSKRHKDAVENLPYSSKVKAYLAAQVELDKALEDLIKILEENNKLDDTVIALVGDHYPYYLTLDEVNEAASYKKDNIVEINRSNFILWNNKMETVHIDKVGSEIDVLPTIYNAFGIDYDSRIIIGNDILSTEPGLAIFSNQSWTSDYGTYFSNTGKFEPKDGVEIPEGYVSAMNNKVSNKVNMSKLIIEKNYYKKVLGE